MPQAVRGMEGDPMRNDGAIPFGSPSSSLATGNAARPASDDIPSLDSPTLLADVARDDRPSGGLLVGPAATIHRLPHYSVAAAIVHSDLTKLTPHERVATVELAAYVEEATQIVAANPDPAISIQDETNRIAWEADELLRITLGKDNFNQLSFMASRERSLRRSTGP